jgi:hypothetical protein
MGGQFGCLNVVDEPFVQPNRNTNFFLGDALMVLDTTRLRAKYPMPTRFDTDDNPSNRASFFGFVRFRSWATAAILRDPRIHLVVHPQSRKLALRYNSILGQILEGDQPVQRTVMYCVIREAAEWWERRPAKYATVGVL